MERQDGLMSTSDFFSISDCPKSKHVEAEETKDIDKVSLCLTGFKPQTLFSSYYCSHPSVKYYRRAMGKMAVTTVYCWVDTKTNTMFFRFS